MRIFNEDKTKEITDYDATKYHTKEDKLFVKHHEAVVEIQEQSHYETIAEYENGGKDVKKIVDIPYQAPQDAYDEYEDILVLVPYTQAELNQQKLGELQNWFETSYRTYCEMFTRRQALGIDDEIVDEFRQKTYHNINELYEEAEKVAEEIKELK